MDLGDGPRDGAADLFIAVEQKYDFVAEKIGFEKKLDGAEGNGDAGFHVERSRTPEAAVANMARHGFDCAEGPDSVEVAEEQDGPGASAGLGAWSKSNFKNVAVIALAVQFDAAA